MQDKERNIQVGSICLMKTPYQIKGVYTNLFNKRPLAQIGAKRCEMLVGVQEFFKITFPISSLNFYFMNFPKYILCN